MIYTLLWVEFLAAMLLGYALFVALAARIRGRLLRNLVAVVGLVVLGLIAAYPFIVAMIARYMQGARSAGMLPLFAGALFVIALAGFGAIQWKGSRAAEGLVAAALWPRARLLSSLLIAVLLTVATFWAADSHALQRAQALRTEASMLSLSVAPAPVPASQNAAALYLQASVRLPHPEDVQFQNAIAPGADVTTPAVAQYLKSQANVLQLIRKAADTPDCRFDANYASPAGVPGMYYAMPGGSDVLGMANLLAAEARRETAAGEVTAAIQDARRIANIATHLTTFPSAISHAVAIRLYQIADETLVGALPQARTVADLPSPEDWLRLDQHLIAQRCLFGDQSFTMAIMYRIVSDELPVSFLSREPLPPSGRSQKVYSAIQRVFFFEDDAAAAKEYFERGRVLIVEPYYRYDHGPFLPPQGLVTAAVATDLNGYRQLIASDEALNRCSVLAIAATRHRLEHGQAPATLDELVPQYLTTIPKDPYSGKPLRMRVSDQGITFYSVGPDREDNGGNIGAPRKSPDLGLVLRK